MRQTKLTPQAPAESTSVQGGELAQPPPIADTLHKIYLATSGPKLRKCSICKKKVEHPCKEESK